MKKITGYILLSLATLTVLYLAVPTTVYSATDVRVQEILDESEYIKFVPGSGLPLPSGFKQEASPALLANYIVELNKFFYRLAIVLAVLMITIGGFQWLIGMGNATKITKAKETIQQAILGLILALTAFLLFSQIDKSFVNLKSLEVGEPKFDLQCEQNNIRATCDAAKRCEWQCRGKKLEEQCQFSQHKQDILSDEEKEECLYCPGICKPIGDGSDCNLFFNKLGRNESCFESPTEQEIACIKKPRGPLANRASDYKAVCCAYTPGPLSCQYTSTCKIVDVEKKIIFARYGSNHCSTECSARTGLFTIGTSVGIENCELDFVQKVSS